MNANDILVFLCLYIHQIETGNCQSTMSSANNFAHAQMLFRMSSLSGRKNIARVNVEFFIGLKKIKQRRFPFSPFSCVCFPISQEMGVIHSLQSSGLATGVWYLCVIYLISERLILHGKKESMHTKSNELYILELISFDIIYQVFEEIYQLINSVFNIPLFIYKVIISRFYSKMIIIKNYSRNFTP